MYISYLSGIQIFIPIKAWYYVISAKYAEQIMIWICQRHYLGYTLQYIPRNMHTVFALLCFVVVIHWLIFPYPSGLLHWHCGNLTIAPVPAKQPWWIWINTSCEFIMNDCITTTKQSRTKPCAYFLGYTVSIAYLFCFVFFGCGHIISYADSWSISHTFQELC